MTAHAPRPEPPWYAVARELRKTMSVANVCKTLGKQQHSVRWAIDENGYRERNKAPGRPAMVEPAIRLRRKPMSSAETMAICRRFAACEIDREQMMRLLERRARN